MPSSLSTTLLVFAAILTAVAAWAGVVVAGLAVLLELLLFYRAGAGDL